MKKTLGVVCATLVLGCIVAAEEKPTHDYNISPVPFTQVQVPSGFWKPRLDTCRDVTIPFCFQKCEETRIPNFAKAGGLQEGAFQGIYFDDSDVYKVIEGAAYVLALRKDAELDKYLDDLIAKIAAAQEPDGYLYTIRTLYQKAKPGDKAPLPPGGRERWTNQGGHELYCVGHLYEAACAHYQATGKRNLLDVAIKSADLICDTFGEGKSQHWPPGHQEIEIGLARLYRVTGNPKYLTQAKYFLDIRGRDNGRKFKPGNAYHQDHLPVVAQHEAVGHAVRANYLYSGMADIAALTGDASYAEAIQAIWKDVVERKLYITGGLGARPKGEAYGDAYELPNDTAYCETCAQIAGIYWNHRMFLDSGDAKYIDVLEKILYNGMLSGVSMTGDRFFYPNVLNVPTGQKKERSPWFGCSCCPSNVCRFLASMPGYVYAVKGSDVYVNLYSDSVVTLEVNGKTVKISQKTNYPWDGKVTLTVHDDANFTLKYRVPGWVRGEVVPGETPLYRFLDGSVDSDVAGLEKGYRSVTKTWKAGETLELDFPMTVRRVVADEKVEADRGRVALQRGPIVFCLEGNDQPEIRSFEAVLLKDNTPLTTEFVPDLLGGVQVIRGQVTVMSETPVEKPFMAIPYYAWAHREPTPMTVWIPRVPEAVQPLSAIQMAELTTSEGCKDVEILRDGKAPKEKDPNFARMHWWPALGSAQWVQYTFASPVTLAGCRVYWFDDTGRGACRVPQSWKMRYRENGAWKDVPAEYGVKADAWNEVRTAPTQVDAVRLEIQSQAGFAGGIYEWEPLLQK